MKLNKTTLLNPRTVRAPLVLVLLTSLPLVSGERVSDQVITRSLQAAFKRDVRLKNCELQVTTSSGAVTLRGTVTSFLDKHQAEQVARRTVGVRSVSNMMQVVSTATLDDELARQVERRLKQSSILQLTNLRVQVASGVVTLTGGVPSWAQSRQADLVTRELRGVKLVRNQLTIAGVAGSGSALDNERIRTNVEATFDRDAYLADLPIRVTVERGLVRLEGEVANLYQKDRATEEARLIDGVRAVDNRLDVVSQLRHDSLAAPPTDEETERAVLDELDVDPRVRAGDIRVTAAGGHVTLDGSVVSMYERQTAERTARRVVGVVRVDNQLQVNAEPRADDDILADIRFNLKSDALLSDQAIVVAVQDAAVTLRGEVSDFNSKTHAVRLASRVRGVRAIANELKVRWTQAISDDAVKRLIVLRLSSSATTHRVADRVHVTVKDGMVTLSGIVERSAELIDAERIAKATDGVRAVDNQISLGKALPRE